MGHMFMYLLCQPPQLKLDRLTHLKLIRHTDLETIHYEIIPDLISQIDELKTDERKDKTITYNEWQKIYTKPAEKSKKVSKVTRKVPVHENIGKMIENWSMISKF